MKNFAIIEAGGGIAPLPAKVIKEARNTLVAAPLSLIVLENEPSSCRGGQELSLVDVCRGLAERGHAIHLVYTVDGDLLDRYGRFCRSITKVSRYDIDRGMTLRSIGEWIGSLGNLHRINADLVYVNQYHDTLFGSALARLKMIPLVCHLRLFPPGTFCGQWRIGLRGVTRFIAVSQATRNAYLQAGFASETVEVVYNGVDLQRFTLKEDREKTRSDLGLSSTEFVVVFVGRIDRHKNIEMLLHAFAQLKKSVSAARLIIAGGPHTHATKEEGILYVAELKALCKALDIDDKTLWLGRRSDVPELFRASDVSVLPSRMPETFGRTLAESMACGTPTLGTRLGGIPEVLQGEFSKFVIDNTAQLVEALGSLVNWREQDAELALRCRKYVEENFDAARMVEGVEIAMRHSVDLGPKRLGPSARVLQKWSHESGLFSI